MISLYDLDWIARCSKNLPLKEIKKEETVAETKDPVKHHQTKIAQQTLKIPDAMVGVMGGPNKQQAREFLKKSSQRRFIRGTENKSKYELIIRQVAAELMNNLFETLPSLTEISRKFAISESTLKRNFKIVYNKSITEYYLEKKMASAKMLVSECNKTITEIAYLFGYEKVSHFISQFKKYNGCLPGLLQKTLIKQIA